MYQLDSSHVWHVAKTGDDGNSGHAGQYPINLANDAKLTIGAAITAASAGDIIIVWPGTYQENVVSDKTLHIVGTDIHKTMVAPTDGYAVRFTSGSDGSVIENITGNGGGTGPLSMGIRLEATQIRVSNCIASGYQNGIYLSSAHGARLSNCYSKSEHDATQLGHSTEVLVDNCIAEALGVSTGVESKALVQLFNSKNTLVRNTVLKATVAASGSDGCAGADCGGQITFINCSINAKTSQTPSSYVAGLVTYDGTMCKALVLVKNCNIDVDAGGGSIYGIYIPKKECYLIDSFITTPTGGNSLKQTSPGILQIAGCRYDKDTVSGNVVTVTVNVDKFNGSEGDVLRLNRATKLLTNKAIQNKSTGSIDYYDDDGETVILTHTPVDGESTIERAPS